MDDIFAQYYEDLLRAQYKVSEALIRDQHLSCGTIREEFLREILIKKRSSIKIIKGYLKSGYNRSSECDQIFHHHDAPTDTLGGQVFIKPEHCKLVLEIKSNASGADFKQTDEKFRKIKGIDPDSQFFCGMFCYNVTVKKDTVLNRFGWTYEKNIDTWNDSPRSIFYPNIDFVVCVASSEEDEECTEKQFFLIKDESTSRYILRLEYPIIKNFFGITDNL